MRKIEFCPSVKETPDTASHRRWTLRVDNHRHHHGLVRLSESPLYLELNYRDNKDARVCCVGVFKLDLNALLDHGFIRYSPIGRKGDTVRLRVALNAADRFVVQTKQSAPACPLGR